MYKKIKKILSDLFLNRNNIQQTNLDVHPNHEDFQRQNEINVKKELLFNPLKPFWKPFSGGIHTENAFKKENRPFNKKDYEIVFNEHISLKNFLNEEKAPYLRNIWIDAKYIDDILEPLRKLNIKYTLDLTGGSVRDFVLNNHKKIKDLDFMLSIPNNDQSWEIDWGKDLEEKGVFTKEQLELVGWDWDAIKYTDEEKKIKLIELCFITNNTKCTIFDHSKRRIETVAVDEYENDILKADRLMAVFKTDGSKTNYPVDILLTDFSKPKFIEEFDFDICKASMCFVNPYVEKAFPKDYTHLISRFVADTEFWADVYNKTITYNTNYRSIYQINRSFDNHLPRILEKYPDSKVIISGYGHNKDYLEKKLFTESLYKSLEKKDEKPQKKLKI